MKPLAQHIQEGLQEDTVATKELVIENLNEEVATEETSTAQTETSTEE